METSLMIFMTRLSKILFIW